MDLFLELRADRLSLAGRGALWTLLSFEGRRLSGALLVQILGPSWRGLAREIARSGIGSPREVAPAVWTFRHYPTPSDRRRASERRRKAASPTAARASATSREIFDRP